MRLPIIFRVPTCAMDLMCFRDAPFVVFKLERKSRDEYNCYTNIAIANQSVTDARTKMDTETRIETITANNINGHESTRCNATHSEVGLESPEPNHIVSLYQFCATLHSTSIPRSPISSDVS